MRLLLLSLAAAALAAAPAARAAVPSTARIVNADGQQLNARADFPAISRDGRWVAFATTATNAVDGAAGRISQVYLADRSTGELRLLSHTPGGAQGNGTSTQPSLSGDGRFVAFQSSATNLVAGTAHVADDVFLFDRATGSLRRLSTSLTGGDGGDWSRDARVSADGSTVVFTSAADDLVAGDTGHWDVFAVSTAGGAVERISTRLGGGTADGDSRNATAGDGGRVVTFATDATDVVAGDTNRTRDIVVVDRAGGQRERADVTATGGQADADANYPAVTADGCRIVFTSAADNLVAGAGAPAVVRAYVRDRCAGNTEVASLSDAGVPGSVINTPPAISDDGCIVAMLSATIVPGAPADGALALRDRCHGGTTRADLSGSGTPGNAGVLEWPRLSAGAGRYVTFASAADNLVLGDGNGVGDAFVRDRGTALPPVADLQVHVDGLRVDADASASTDPDGASVSTTVGWGDGSADDAGPRATHRYPGAGRYTVSLLVTDSDGLVATARRVVTVSGADATIPVVAPALPPVAVHKLAPAALTHVALSRRAFAPRHGHRGGSRLTLTIDEPAVLSARFARVLHARPRTAGTLTAALRAGRNTLGLTGRVSGHALKPGRYRLTLVARTPDGRRSPPVIRTLTITKERR